MPRSFLGAALLACLPTMSAGCGTDLEPPVVATVTVTPGAATLAFLGESAAFTATATDQYGNPFAGTVAWTSDAPNVFTVSPAGVATAVSNGAGTIRAQVDGVSGTATVTVSQKPTAVERVAGDAQRGRPGTPLVDPLIARVLDAGGSPVAGTAVFFSPADGSGLVAPGTAPTNMAGEARASWTLGDDFGPQSLVASVPDGANTVFTATALRPNELADSVRVVSGDGQAARPGRGLHRPIVVRVLDEYGIPIEGATVQFVAPPGHGFADPDSVRSDRQGQAATTWTLGDKSGLQLLTASVPGGPSARLTAMASLGVCERTPQVADALVAATEVASCELVTNALLEQIRELDLSESGIATLGDHDFAGLFALEVLSVRDNRLEKLPVEVFSGLSALTSLDLGANRLQDLPPDIFAALSSLTGLDLGANRFVDLPSGIFNGMSSLKHLMLYGNQLKDLQAGVFAGLSKLESLLLGENPLKLRPGAFSELAGLRSLGLFGSDELTELPSGAFDGLASLEHLSLSQNRLSKLPSDVFAGLSELETLSLEDNELTNLPPGIFSDLSKLRLLWLWGNQLDLSPGVFAGLSSLERLDLYLNGLTDLPVGLFRGLTKLDHLDLGGNQLHLQPRIFAEDLGALTYLSLYENEISDLPPGVFDGLSSLERLDLYANRQTELSAGLFQGLGRLRALWLDGNPRIPFPLVLRIERADTADVGAPGPATLVVKLDQGAPFDIHVNLSAPGATLSTSTVTISTGATRGNAVTVTANTQGTVTVTLDTLPRIPQGRCRFFRRSDGGRVAGGGIAACYTGLVVETGGPVTLFR